jgi:CheY-like chemotaxis protein
VFRTCPEWSLQVAADGANGLAAARALPPDLVIVDMNLPDMNGIELVQALRLDPSTRALRCIALSADAMQPQIDAACAAGFDDYWTKPIDVPRVLTALAQVLA